MLGCCRPEHEEREEAVATKRRLRDIPFLLLFVAFCGGCVYVTVTAFSQGDPKRLWYGLDSYGNVCGAKNNWNREGNGPDLTDKKKLYFLDPFDLANPLQLQYAKAVCVEECPMAAEVCNISSLPCLSTDQYRCPYYAVAEDGLAGTLKAVDAPWSVNYWDSLATTNASCQADLGIVPAGMQAAFHLTGPLPNGTTACGVYYQAQSQVPGSGPCYPIFAESVEFMNRCLPKLPSEMAEKFGAGHLAALTGASMNNNRDRLQRYIADIGRGLYVILAAGLGVALVLSVIWLVFLRFFAGFMAWLTILAVNVLFTGCTILCYQKAGMLGSWGQVGAYMSQELGDLGAAEDPSQADREDWVIVAYVMSGVTGVLFILTLFMIRRIKIAVATLKVASQAASAVPTIFIFPVIPFLFTVGFTAYWAIVAGYLWSAGDILPQYRDAAADSADSSSNSISLQDLLDLVTGSPASVNSMSVDSLPSANFTLTDESCANNPNCFYSIVWSTEQRYLFIYHLFSLLWVFQFIVGFGYVSIAGAVAHFYWSRGDRNAMPPAPLLSSVANTISYHLGSVALGSFIIAIVQFVRIAFEWLAARFKKLQEKSGLKYIVWLIRGLLWLLEIILKFINRNAFIQVAVKGTSYCTSAGRATTLLVANALRVAAVNTIGDFLIFLGKLAVASGSGVAAMLLSNLKLFTDPVAYPDTYLSSPILPVAVSVFTGFTVAHIFLQVYEMAVDTVLLCFCEDCESHNGHPVYAPELLMDAIGLAQEEAARRNKDPSQVADENRGAFIVAKQSTEQPAPNTGMDWEIRSSQLSSRV